MANTLKGNKKEYKVPAPISFIIHICCISAIEKRTLKIFLQRNLNIFLVDWNIFFILLWTILKIKYSIITRKYFPTESIERLKDWKYT